MWDRMLERRLDRRGDAGHGGLALIDHLRAQSVSLPALLVMTGRVTADVEARAAAAGLPILAKPLDPASVMTALQRSLAG